MPELPEVECVARALRKALIGARVAAASLHHPGVLRRGGAKTYVRPRGSVVATLLLEGGTISAVHRHGKHLALEVADGRALVVHLGMSGRLAIAPVIGTPDSWRPVVTAPISSHAHARWVIARGRALESVQFVDPRRFGGLRAFESIDAVRAECWCDLGPDALLLEADDLARACAGSARAVKALLLDQSVVAGIGNIYADEILHRAGIHPETRARRLVDCAAELARVARSVLRRAIERGGSTIRDYVTPNGRGGSYQLEHRVYGRHGRPCLAQRRGVRCDSTIETLQVAGRTTAFCPACQPRTGLIHRSPSMTEEIVRSHSDPEP